MKLKASGVIEPDFKIKEGKKKKKGDNEDGSSKRKEESSLTVSDQSTIKRKMSLKKNSRKLQTKKTSNLNKMLL